MAYIFLGVLAFLLFVISDINSIIMKNKLLNSCFFMGFILLVIATAGIILSEWDKSFRMLLFGFLAFIFLILLIYTLFFALPFKKTYIDTHSSPKVCDSGVYALCRHPGVLWFIGFYLFFGLALNMMLLLLAAFIFSSLNIIYVVFQDRWTFINTFDNYEKYKINTPFLLPNIKSIKRCLHTLLGKEELRA